MNQGRRALLKWSAYMPKVPSPMSAISGVRSFIDVMKELSFDEVREAAERMPRMVILAEDRAVAEQIGEALTGVPGSPAISVDTLDAPVSAVDRADVVIVHDVRSGKSFARWRSHAPQGGMGIFDLPVFDPDSTDSIAQLRTRIANQLPELAPALGRWFTPFRPAAAKSVIDESAKVNAQFALVANIPSVIPVVGSFAAAGADFLALTKNQLMLIFKLAAIHDRDLHDKSKVIREMVPVVGAGFAWRTLAREATDFLPFAAGTIPKVAIAFSGTLAIGWAAEFYYRYGRKPTKQELKAYLSNATDTVKDFRFANPTNREPATPPPAIEHG